MKVVLFLSGVMVGLCFQHIPRRPWFNDEPGTPADHHIKEYWYIGGRRVEKSEYDAAHYFNGGA